MICFRTRQRHREPSHQLLHQVAKKLPNQVAKKLLNHQTLRLQAVKKVQSRQLEKKNPMRLSQLELMRHPSQMLKHPSQLLRRPSQMLRLLLRLLLRVKLKLNQIRKKKRMPPKKIKHKNQILLLKKTPRSQTIPSLLLCKSMRLRKPGLSRSRI